MACGQLSCRFAEDRKPRPIMREARNEKRSLLSWFAARAVFHVRERSGELRTALAAGEHLTMKNFQ